MKAQVDDPLGMFEEKTSYLAGVGKALADADKEDFEVGAFRMRGSSVRSALRLPLLNQGPFEQRKKALVLDNKIMRLKAVSFSAQAPRRKEEQYVGG